MKKKNLKEHLIVKFNYLSVQVKYQLLEYEFMKNVKKVDIE